MRRMVVRLSVALAVTVVCIGLVSPASALTVGDSRYIGRINDGIPSDTPSATGYLNTLIDLAPGALDQAIGSETYNRIGSTFDCSACPDAVVAGAIKQDNDNTSFDLGAGGFTYLLGKYDAGNAGVLVWFVGGLTGVVTLPATFNGQQFGLSHSIAFNPGTNVPEPGTLLLLGSALVAVGVFRRKMM